MTTTPFFDIRDKVAVVTGGGSGIGEAIARRFCQAGAKAIVADLDAEQAKRVARLINDTGDAAQARALDVANISACEAFAEQVSKAYGEGLDVLVNCAGIGYVGTILQTEWTDLDRLNKVNLGGVFNLSKAFLPSMIERGRGSIINIASICGVIGVVDRLAYNATKFAVVGLTKSMALDHAATGVRVNAICPARVKTSFVEARIQEYPDPAVAFKEMSESQPVGRMADPEEIAAAAHYLASDESAFMTGTAFCIDGGYSAGK